MGDGDLPNDPLTALICDEGYIINPDGTGCIPETSVIVHGVITAMASGLPIAGVTVTVQPFDSDPVQTDANGYFRVTGGPTSDDDIIVMYSHPEYLFKATPINDSQNVAKLPGEPDRYWHVEMSADSNTLAAVGMNGTALLWRAPSWAEIEAAEQAETTR